MDNMCLDINGLGDRRFCLTLISNLLNLSSPVDKLALWKNRK